MSQDRKLILNIKKQTFAMLTVHFVEAEGTINFESAQFFRQSVEELMTNDAGNVILDGQKIKTLDSVGLGTLHALQNSAWSFKGNLYLVNFSHLMPFFENLDIISFFKFADSAEAALNIIKQENNIEIDDFPVFPAVIACPNCRQKMKIQKPAAYRCPKCKNIIKVDEQAQVVLIKQHA